MICLSLTGGGGPIMGDLWALKGLIDEGSSLFLFLFLNSMNIVVYPLNLSSFLCFVC